MHPIRSPDYHLEQNSETFLYKIVTGLLCTYFIPKIHSSKSSPIQQPFRHVKISLYSSWNYRIKLCQKNDVGVFEHLVLRFQDFVLSK